MNDDRLQYLLDRYFDEDLNPAESSELQITVAASEQAAAVFWENARWHALLLQWAAKVPALGKEVA